MFASKCAKCQEIFTKNELFIRTPFYRRYHIDCFRCDHCNHLLTSGDEYYLNEQNQIFCRQDFQQIQSIGTSTAGILQKKKKKRMACIHTDIRSDVKEGIDGVRVQCRKSDQSRVLSFHAIYERMTTNQSTPFKPDTANKCTCRLKDTEKKENLLSYIEMCVFNRFSLLR